MIRDLKLAFVAAKGAAYFLLGRRGLVGVLLHLSLSLCNDFIDFIVEDSLFFVALALKCVMLFTPDTLEGATSSQNLVNRSLSSYFTILVFFLQGHTLLSCYDIHKCAVHVHCLKK